MDDKLILGITPEATDHLIARLRSDAGERERDCPLCEEVVDEAVAALADMRERAKEEEAER